MKIAEAALQAAKLPDINTGSPAKPHAEDDRLIDTVRSKFKKPAVEVERPVSEYPELIVRIPDSWPHVDLAPLYDVHIGNSAHDAAMFARHAAWIAKQPYVVTFNGGDMIENASKLSVGAGVYDQDFSPQNQLVQAAMQLASMRHKMLFALPGNHEDRTAILGVDVGRWLAWLLDLAYFGDYCACTIKFAGQNYRLLAHHGSGAAQSPGGHRNAARKDLAWGGCFDIFWTGHLHNPLADPVQRMYYNRDGRMVERNAIAIISPSYVKFFGTYAGKKRYPPGQRGLTVLRLNRDGRMDTSIYVHGCRE